MNEQVEKIENVSMNVTAGITAKKNGAELPQELEIAFTIINSTIDTLNGLDVPENQKVAKLAEVAEKQYAKAAEFVGYYNEGCQATEDSFFEEIDKLSKPKDTVEAIQQSGWQAAMVQSGKEGAQSLARTDPLLAAAALQLPAGLAKKVGLGGHESLKEVLSPGYLNRKKQFEVIKENGALVSKHIDTVLKPLFNSVSARKAVSDIKQLRAL